jgi:hypothetical protein
MSSRSMKMMDRRCVTSSRCLSQLRAASHLYQTPHRPTLCHNRYVHVSPDQLSDMNVRIYEGTGAHAT